MKKKWHWLPATVLCLVLTFTFTACSGSGKNVGVKEEDTSISQAEGGENTGEDKDIRTEQPKENTYIFTDSTGREVEIPQTITKVASAGPLANIMLYAVKPEVIVGWSSSPSEIAKKYIDEQYWDLPEYGKFYDAVSDFNREALMASSPDLIIDVGEWDETYKKDLDVLQEQIGIPVILIEANLEQNANAYRTLGELLGEQKRGEELAAYCDEVLKDAKEKAATIPEEEKVRIYYGQDDGLSTMLSGSIHAQIYELVGAVVVADADSVQVQQGGGTVSMEQLMAWDPDVIMFVKDSIYDTVADDPTWSGLTAIKNGTYYEIPVEPYNWLGRPPGPNRMIGVRWLGNLLYPELFDYDIEQEVKDYFSLFYRYELSDDEVQNLLAGSTLKAAKAE